MGSLTARYGGALLLGAALAGAARPAEAQELRTMTVSRQVGEVSALDVHVRYGAGEIRIRPADQGLLYRMELRYDEEIMDPVASFDGRRLEVGVDAKGRNLRIGRDHRAGSMDLRLSRGVPMDLELELGAVEADLDLGGLHLTDLDLTTGASASTVDVSQPNPLRLESARLEVGAADFSARRLANLNAERLSVSAGVGQVTLDFSGQWRRDLHVDVEMGLGSLELRFPEGVGVRLVKESFLTSLDSQGLLKQGDAWVSPDWDQARHRITVDVEAAFGSIEVVWLR